MIAANQGDYAIELMCRALDVSVSGYYAWRNRPPSQHEQDDAALLAEMRAIHQASRGFYGSPRIHAALAQADIHVSRKRVARLMREALGVRALSRRTDRSTWRCRGYPPAPR